MKSIIISMVAATGLIVADNVMAEEMLALSKKLNCTACHAIDKKVVGPAWRDIAKKYAGNGVAKYTYNGEEFPLIEGLVKKVSKGGSGNWGDLPMPASDALGTKQAEITEMVRFVQSLTTK
jgi:cytochrome c